MLDGFTLTNGTGTYIAEAATAGGGVYTDWDCTPTITNCIISGNNSNSYGGGIRSRDSSIIVNSTIVGNYASGQGAGINCSHGGATVMNSIIRDNTTGYVDPEISGLANVTYSNIKGGYAGEGNIDMDPLFVNATGGDFHLQPGSPCIDAGNNAAVPDWITTDFEGDPRIVDGDGDTVAVGDMGADEFVPSAPTIPPSVTTNPATNVTTNSATLNGTLTSLGSASTVNVSFEWGTTSGVYPNETTPQAMTTTGPFRFNLSGLSPGTTYHFRAKAVGDGTSFGLDKSFTTEMGVVTVSINAPDEVLENFPFTTTVNISDVVDLNAAQYDVSFDNTVLRLDDVTSGQIDTTEIPVMAFNEISPGTWRVVQSLLLGTVSGSGSLAVLHFHVIGTECQRSEINLSNGILSGLEAEIPATWTGDSVHVVLFAVGDVNGDGVVNVLDITKLARIIVGLDDETPGADANQDGVVNVLDITKIARIIVGLD